MPELKAKQSYTYQDYLAWPENQRWEIIEGIAYDMTPAPNPEHQSVLVELTRLISAFLMGKPCTLLIAPLDVVLSKQDVVQPDLIVVCDETKITQTHVQGAPDLAIEILSPSTAAKDRREKKRLYQKYGVKEYILVDPAGRFMERFLLNKKGVYDPSEIFDDQ